MSLIPIVATHVYIIQTLHYFEFGPQHVYASALAKLCSIFEAFLKGFFKDGLSFSGLLQNIAVYSLLGGQCSQTPLFTHHLPSHTGGAVNLVAIRLQPKVSLFTVFWARAAPKHRYLHAFGRPLLPSTFIYAAFAFSSTLANACLGTFFIRLQP